MKLLNIALLLVAIQSDGKSGAGLTTVDAATPYLRSDANVEETPEETPEEILMSPMCEDFVKGHYKEVKKVLKEDKEDEIIDFLCNSVAIEVALDRSLEAEENAKTETNPCAKAMEEKLANTTSDLLEFANSTEACIAAIKDEYKQYKKGVKEVECCPLATVGVDFISDINLKTNINFVGMSAWGIPTYTFKYREGAKNLSGGALDTESTYFGAMAQDLLELAPEAVTKSKVNGYYAVDYSKIDVDFYKIA